MIWKMNDFGAEDDSWAMYTVKSGDTLSQISLSYYGDFSRVQEIARNNGIEDVNKIRVGQTLILDPTGMVSKRASSGPSILPITVGPVPLPMPVPPQATPPLVPIEVKPVPAPIATPAPAPSPSTPPASFDIFGMLQGAKGSFLMRQYYGVPVWQWAIGGTLVLGGLYLATSRPRTASNPRRGDPRRRRR